MDIASLKKRIPDFAKDLRINLSNVLSADGAPGLNDAQRHGTAIAVAYALGDQDLLQAVESNAGEDISLEYRKGARAASAIMGMNNIYYRFLHLSSNPEYGQLPARLRMSVIGNPGIEKADFELFSLAVSAVNGCGLCVDSHEKVIRQHGISAEGIQSAVRIAAVLHAVAAVLKNNESDQALAAAA